MQSKRAEKRQRDAHCVPNTNYNNSLKFIPPKKNYLSRLNLTVAAQTEQIISFIFAKREYIKLFIYSK